MSLSGRLVSQTEVKANGDVFHEIFAHRPHQLASSCPHIVQSFALLRGSWGTAGSMVFANYTHEGTKKVAKAIIEAVDNNRKSVTYKIIEGDILQLYRTFTATVRVETRGGRNIVTWIMEYVKKTSNIPDPNSVMDLAVTITKGIEASNAR